MPFYANIDQTGLCIGVTETLEAIADPNSIEIDGLDGNYLYRKFENNQWSIGKFPPTLVEQETAEQKIARLEQQIQADNLVTFEVLATIYEELLAQKGSV
jgi:hypothetical protein